MGGGHNGLIGPVQHDNDIRTVRINGQSNLSAQKHNALYARLEYHYLVSSFNAECLGKGLHLIMCHYCVIECMMQKDRPKWFSDSQA